MNTPEHPSGLKCSYLVETAYASGKGSTKYDATVLVDTDVGLLTSIGFLYKNNPKFPYIKRRDEVIREGFSLGVNEALTFVVGNEYYDSSITKVLQTSVFLQAALTGDTDTLPTSFLIHVETPNGEYYDAVGCTVLEYKISATSGDDKSLVVEEITFGYWDVKDSVAVTSHPGKVTTQPVKLSGITLTIGSTEYTTIHSLETTIKNTIDGTFVVGQEQRIDPYISGREIEFMVECKIDHDDIMQTVADTSITYYTVAEVIGALGTFSATNMKLSHDDVNINEYPEKGFKTQSFKFIIGGDSTVTFS